VTEFTHNHHFANAGRIFALERTPIKEYFNMRLFAVAAVFFIFINFSCSPAYYKKISGNTAVQKKTSEPDYSKMEFWAAHPLKHDPSDSMSTGIHDTYRDSTVDVFFLHPTTFTDQKRVDELNAPLTDDTLNVKTDYSSMLYQASVFNADARIFAPRYRQAHIGMYFYNDTVKAKEAFELAYSDIKAAFIYYLDHYNNGRPIIIASHSQGTTHAKRLIREFFDGQVLKNRLVVAYLLGIYVDQNQFQTIPVCRDSLQTGCFVSWRTFRRDFYGPEYIALEPPTAAVVNPLTWSTDSSLAPKSLNRGAVLYKYNKVFPHTNDAQIKGNILWISRPKFPGGVLYQSKNYHVGDYNLFYMNIRQDIRRRISLFWK
jgi:hypothetical protein